ncbi:3'-N-debenzoyl-2'-deoxytaxol N-benzoyltransferase isoform X1 [Cryptomeria japonica]|uniref:3'-N-debenzoyl-2'-deoxytaxol N-benzoyltransferase isoform X1 n=1 Tax=Cryptomeria japonica TaxID=3369 RepID=UPI0025ACBC8B|nr:3'-N-debenzoyl-2'-deoxytaxol N-benzoyltransferase isoform X1 [Cryptomeria japonica]
MEKECLAELNVKIVESCLVPPCLPSPKPTLYLSNLDNQPAVRMVINAFLVYEACENVLADPAKTIQEALSKVLVYYYPVAGRLRKKEDGKLQLECTGEGVLFVEAIVDNSLSVLGDLNQIKPSFKQLFFWFPSNTAIEDVHPMVLQVNRFTCGGFVVAVSFHHIIFDGQGVGNFLKNLGEMARGHVKPSIEPIWERDILKPSNVLVQDLKLIEEKIESTSHSWKPPIHEESIQMSLTFDYETIKYMKQRITQECMDICTTFEIVAALVWRARIKALKIPHTQSAKFFFATNVRGSFNPPLPNGYYGNGFIFACAQATVHDVMNQPLSYIVNIIKKTKMSLNNKYLRSTIDMDQFPSDIFSNQANMLLSDWRWLGFNEVDFGLGSPVNICPMHWNENGINISNAFFFLHPPKGKVDGFKMITWMPLQKFQLFEMEVEAIVNKYIANDFQN